MDESRPLHLIADAAELAKQVERMRGAQRLAVDTEANGFHAYRERVCMIQISTTEEDWILDMIALDHPGPLAELLGDESCLKLLHGADFDVVSLKRDYGIAVTPLLDTAVASQLLGIERFGLADLAECYAGVTLDKRYQRCDWARRPLEEAQVEYLRNDTRYLFDIAEALQSQLAEADLLEEARLEFERVEAREWTERSFEPDRWSRIKGVADLDDLGRAVLRALFRLRDEMAAEADRPPFKVLPDRVLLQLAHRRPKRGAQLSRVRGIPSALRMRASTRILDAIAEGRRAAASGPVPLPRPVHRHQRSTPEVERRVKRLKAWRREAAEKDGRTTLAVLPNPVLLALAEDPVIDRPALAAFPGLGQRRAERYGADIISVLSGSAG